MTRRRRSSWIDLVEGFNSGYDMVSRVLQDKELTDISSAQQESTTSMMETNAPDPALYTYDEETGQYAPSLNAIESGGADGLQPVRPQFDSRTSTQFLGKTYEQPLTPEQERSARLRAQADVIGKTDPASAARLRAAGIEIDAAERKVADEAELRQALRPRNDALRSSAGSGADLGGASAVPLHTDTAGQKAVAADNLSPASQARQGVRKVQGFRDPLEHYINDTMPKIVTTLIKQGQLDHAQRYLDFLQSQQGHLYAKIYTSGLRKFAVGDNEGALADFQDLYNRDDLYPDGRNVKLIAMDGGQMRIDQFDAEGKLLGSRTGKIADLTQQAALALNPLQAVQFMAKEQAKRDSEAALLDRQTQLETLRQQGRETAEDRRDARLVQTLESRERAAANRSRGGLTAAQERSNAEIDAARERITGMSPEEIRKRTAKQTDTGRENEFYDPSLARAASLASRRKIGQDDVFDSRENTPKSQAFDMDDLRKRFRSDGAMNNYSLGEYVPGKGAKVMQKGRQIGWYQ